MSEERVFISSCYDPVQTSVLANYIRDKYDLEFKINLGPGIDDYVFDEFSIYYIDDCSIYFISASEYRGTKSAEEEEFNSELIQKIISDCKEFMQDKYGSYNKSIIDSYRTENRKTPPKRWWQFWKK